MASRWLRRLFLLAAQLLGAAALAFAHDAGPTAFHLDSWNKLVAPGIAVAILLSRWVSKRSSHGRAAILAAVLSLTVLWALPWMSFHDTHHLLEGKSYTSVAANDEACPVAQIAHTNAGGVLPSVLAPALPLPSGPAVLPSVAALASRVVPEPAARSPPV